MCIYFWILFCLMGFYFLSIVLTILLRFDYVYFIFLNQIVYLHQLVFCKFILLFLITFNISFLISTKRNFDWGCMKFIEKFGENCHYNHTAHSDPRVWRISLFI